MGIRWGLIIQGLLCNEKDFKFNSGFNKDPMSEKHALSFLVLVSTFVAAFWIN